MAIRAASKVMDKKKTQITEDTEKQMTKKTAKYRI